VLAAFAERRSSQIIFPTLAADGTGHAGKDIIRVTADQSNSADNDHQNHRKHNRVLGNVLAFFL
jgi:hypothetical protein